MLSQLMKRHLNSQKLCAKVQLSLIGQKHREQNSQLMSMKCIRKGDKNSDFLNSYFDFYYSMFMIFTADRNAVIRQDATPSLLERIQRTQQQVAGHTHKILYAVV